MELFKRKKKESDTAKIIRLLEEMNKNLNELSSCVTKQNYGSKYISTEPNG